MFKFVYTLYHKSFRLYIDLHVLNISETFFYNLLKYFFPYVAEHFLRIGQIEDGSFLTKLCEIVVYDQNVHRAEMSESKKNML